MTIDVIILSYTKNDSIIKMNNDCINSLNSSSDQHTFNIFLIETESLKNYKYEQKNVTVIQPKIEFNYNKFLNIGFKECKNDWVLISNNDTIYHKNFLESLLEANNQDPEILSMSPMDDSWYRHTIFNKDVKTHYGYRTSYEVAGWSILVNRSVIDIIGGFDEQFTFWYQDNDYASSLMVNGIKHALITNSKVTHLLNRSHGLIEQEKKYSMTDGLGVNFLNKWNK
jgi:GT2 family glycosyltransferase